MSIVDRLTELDRRLMDHAFRARSASRDRGLVTITQAANYSQLWMAIAAVLSVVGGRRGRSAAGRGLVAVTVAAIVANGPAKLLARRRRPFSDTQPTLITPPISTSFPSGHSAAAFAFATGATLELPALAPLLVPLAGAVAYSRVHTGVHYPSDVAAGTAIGVVSGYVTARRTKPRVPSAPKTSSDTAMPSTM